MLSSFHKQLLNNYQLDFPLTPRPYKAIAEMLDSSEEEVLLAIQELNDQGLISRIGPIIKPNQIGKSMLVALSVPQSKLQQVADIISSFPEVNHNYERENHFNLWFVLIANNDEHLQNTLINIEQQSGYKTMQLPLLADYYINLGFELDLNDGCDRLPTD